MVPRASADERTRMCVCYLLSDGLLALQQGKRERPLSFSDHVLKWLCEIIVSIPKDFRFYVVVNREKIAIHRKIVRHIERHILGSYTRRGSIDGYLDEVRGRESVSFSMLDENGNNIICYVPDEMESTVAGALFHPVRVWGVITYNRNGIPMSARPYVDAVNILDIRSRRGATPRFSRSGSQMRFFRC